MCKDGLEFEKMVLNLKRLFQIQKEGFMIKRSLNRLKGFKSEKNRLKSEKMVLNMIKMSLIWIKGFKSEKNVSNL